MLLNVTSKGEHMDLCDVNERVCMYVLYACIMVCQSASVLWCMC